MQHDSHPPALLEVSEVAPVPSKPDGLASEPWSEGAASRIVERKRGFVLALADDASDGGGTVPAPLGCAEVQGFDDALMAAGDPSALAPLRLALVAPDEETIAWLERWAEDAEQVRRRIAVRRVEDGATVTVIVTIASFGAGVAPSLAVESIRSHWGGICRSGVHSRAEVEAALARYDAGGRGSEPPAWPCDE